MNFTQGESPRRRSSPAARPVGWLADRGCWRVGRQGERKRIHVLLGVLGSLNPWTQDFLERASREKKLDVHPWSLHAFVPLPLQPRPASTLGSSAAVGIRVAEPPERHCERAPGPAKF